jgi:hypothetical protein
MPPGDRQGIPVQGLKAARTLRHIHITDCRISDLQGTLGYYSCGLLVTAPGWQDARGADPRLSVADVVCPPSFCRPFNHESTEHEHNAIHSS